MTDDTTAAAATRPDLQGPFRADPAAHWPIILVLVVLTLLALVGVVWVIIRPGPIDIGRILTALLLGTLAVVFVAVAGYFWLRLQRRIQLRERGLEYFDGRQTHLFSWDDVRDIYEVITSVKLLGLTVDAPNFGALLVTKDGVRCEIDSNMQGFQTLGPLVSGEVNASLLQRARSALKQGGRVPFGQVSLSQRGVVIEEATAQPWWEMLKQRFEGHTEPRVAVPGEYGWQDIRAIQIVPAVHGEKWADHTTYNQLEIQTRHGPVYGCPVPVFPNFAVFTEILNELKHPLVQAERS